MWLCGVMLYGKKKKPEVGLRLEAASSGVTLTGIFKDYVNKHKYSDIVGSGILYMNSARLGTRTLTLATNGKTNLMFNTYRGESNTFPATRDDITGSTSYTFRAYMYCKNPDTGLTETVYSSIIRTNRNALLSTGPVEV